jgi:hypothetical protein
LGFEPAALIVTRRFLSCQPSSLCDLGNMAIAKRGMRGGVRTCNRVLRWWIDDIRMIAKAVGQKIAGLSPIIGAIGNDAIDRAIYLIKKIRQGCRITDLICGQFVADDLTADQIEPEM